MSNAVETCSMVLCYGVSRSRVEWLWTVHANLVNVLIASTLNSPQHFQPHTFRYHPLLEDVMIATRVIITSFSYQCKSNHVDWWPPVFICFIWNLIRYRTRCASITLTAFHELFVCVSLFATQRSGSSFSPNFIHLYTSHAFE